MADPRTAGPDPDDSAAWSSALREVEHRAPFVEDIRPLPGEPGLLRWVYLADHATYPPQLQARWARFQSSFLAFPRGFTLWWGAGIPVGYTAWHPVDPAALVRLDAQPTLDEPLVPIAPGAAPELYVFNYSLIAPLRKAPFSGMILRTLAAQLAVVRPARLAAGVVSPEGGRVAARFGMVSRGPMKSPGWSWWSS